MGHRHTADMPEISGFGGAYEEACQNMLEAGTQWMDEHPAAKVVFSTFQGVTGLITDESDDAKALEKVMADAVGGDCTGAMMHTLMLRVLFIKAQGWDTYCQRLREETDDE